MKRILGTLAVLVVLAAPTLAAAGIDAPHDQAYGSSTFACDNCHQLSQQSASGVQNFNLGCITCHNTPGFAYPWSAGDQAKPGLGGKHHSWSTFAENPARGATFPTNATLAGKLVDGNLQCAVCHNAHQGAPENAPNSRKLSMPLGTPRLPTSGGGSATMTLVSAANKPIATRVKISAAGGFIFSHDYGQTPSTWYNWSGSWQVGVDDGPGRPIAAGTTYALEDAAYTVRFSAVPPAGASWDFVVSFPFVRLLSGVDEICLTCHASRVMKAQRVRGEDPWVRPNGTRLFSHPVGEALGSNGRSTDNAMILDANGASSQTVGDGFAHNDLVLRANTVMCTTCHAVHGADSNSLTP